MYIREKKFKIWETRWKRDCAHLTTHKKVYKWKGKGVCTEKKNKKLPIKYQDSKVYYFFYKKKRDVKKDS